MSIGYGPIGGDQTLSSRTVGDLIIAVLPRLVSAPKGINIYQAANAALSIVYKRLLYWKSDILASGELGMTIPPFGRSASLPEDFVAMAEKPKQEDVYTDWMTGTVTSYDAASGTLVLNVTNASGSDTLNSCFVAMAEFPGSPSNIVGQSITSLTPTTGAVTLVTDKNLLLNNGQYIFVVPSSMPSTLHPRKRTLQPEPFDEDHEHDDGWWSYYYGTYGTYGNEVAYYHRSHRSYKIVGNTFYVHPVPVQDIIITGKYFQKPLYLSGPADALTWSILFYQVYKEAVVRIITKGIAIPDADSDFMAFINREVDTVCMSRTRIMPQKRTSHRNFM